jgi:hypothetical protein
MMDHTHKRLHAAISALQSSNSGIGQLEQSGVEDQGTNADHVPTAELQDASHSAIPQRVSSPYGRDAPKSAGESLAF